MTYTYTLIFLWGSYSFTWMNLVVRNLTDEEDERPLPLLEAESPFRRNDSELSLDLDDAYHDKTTLLRDIKSSFRRNDSEFSLGLSRIKSVEIQLNELGPLCTAGQIFTKGAGFLIICGIACISATFAIRIFEENKGILMSFRYMLANGPK